MKKLSIALFCVLTSGAAHAFVAGGSNLFPSDYPEFSEYPPSQPINRDRASLEDYRQEVLRYVKAANEYADNADHDIERIQESQQKAFDAAKQVVDEFKQWAVDNDY